MPNHVSHVLEFDVKHAERVFAECCPNGHFDFNAFIKVPLNVYQGGLGKHEEQDFGNMNCWYDWSILNWGTKWNAYNSRTSIEGNVARIHFDTAWSIPYPIIIAFSNKFGISFQHRYFDEGYMFWGHEGWTPHLNWRDDNTVVERRGRRFMLDEDKDRLCLELQGYHPNPPDITYSVDEPIVKLPELQPIAVAVMGDDYVNQYFFEDEL